MRDVRRTDPPNPMVDPDEQLQRIRHTAICSSIAGLSQHLNNLTASIVLSADFLRSLSALKKSPALPQDTGAWLERIAASAAELSDVVRLLLDFTGERNLMRYRTPLRPLMVTLIRAIEERLPTSVSLDVKMDVQACDLQIDPDSLRAAFDALVDNALDALDAAPRENGHLRLTVSEQPVDSDLAFTSQVHDAASLIVICLEDDGVGIPAADLPFAFDPFFSTKSPSHYGLGLTVAHGYVRQNLGRIRLTSSPGKGTTVCISLPGYPPSYELLGEVEQVGHRGTHD